MVHILRALQKLLHVQLDLARREFHAFVLQQAGQIVVHVRRDHVHRHGRIFAFAFINGTP